MKTRYTKPGAIKSKFALAALAICFYSATESLAASSDPEIIGHVLKEGALQRYVAELKAPLVISYNGQKYYLENSQSEMVPLTAATAVAGTKELEVLKVKTRKNGSKARLKMQFADEIVKTTARVCPAEETTCKPCSNWQIRFLSKRKQGNKLPDNFLFIS